MVEKQNAPGKDAGKPAPEQKPHANVRVLEALRGREDADVSAAKASRKTSLTSRFRWRHGVLAAGFAGLVLAPTLLAGLYMAVIAADQHSSKASFAVRSIESSAAASDILGMFSQATSGSTTSDSYILLDYIRSGRMLGEVEQAFDLNRIYARRGMDFFYGLASGLPREDRLDYWRSMVSVHFDLASGIIDLEVKAFEPEDARSLTQFVIERSEALVNELSATAREEVLRTAYEELSMAEKRLSDARMAVREYRDISQEIDPGEEAKLAAALIGTLEQQLAQTRAEMSALQLQMAGDSPRVRVLAAKITSIERQIEAERQRVGSGDRTGDAGEGTRSADVAGRILTFETLETEREFAERTYTAALSSLEKARLEANGKQRYFALFIPPGMSELAQYPARIFNTFLVFLAGLFAWGVATMAYYNIRDRA